MGGTSRIISSRQGPFSIHVLRDEELPYYFSAWRAAFGKEPDREMWEWKFRRCPAPGGSLVCVDSRGRVAVHYGGMGQKVWFSGSELHAIQLVDVFTHPKYRWAIGGKRGLFYETARSFWQTYLRETPFGPELAVEGGGPPADLFWGLPGRRHAKLGRIVMNYGLLPPAGYGVLGLQRRRRLGLRRLERLEPRRDPLPDDLDDLWLRGRRAIPFGVVKDGDYLQWRYWDPVQRGRGYILYLLRSLIRGRLKGWVAIKEPQEVEEGVVIMDWLCEDQDAFEEILCAVSRFYPATQLKIWMSDLSPMWKTLERMGVKRAPEPLGIVPSLQSYIPAVAGRSDQFHWTIGDSDIF